MICPKLPEVYDILRKHDIPLDNFDYYDEDEWGILFMNTALTNDEREEVLDELVDLLFTEGESEP